MGIHVPGRHAAFEPFGVLRHGHFGGGKKGQQMALNLTAMVDMFTVIVIFLLQSFSASGEIMFIQKDLKLPTADEAQVLEDRGPVVTLYANTVLMEGEEIAKLDDLDDAEQGITALSDRLTKIREREEKIKPRDMTQPYDGHCIIQADVATDFKLVRKTIFAINQAGWTHLNFATLEQGPVKEEGEVEG
ncbi:MAG: ExbD/TolR family protein [Acidovorax sp.]